MFSTRRSPIRSAFAGGQPRYHLPRTGDEPLTTQNTFTAFAPASVGNAAVGFDLLGHSIEGPGDRITARKTVSSGAVLNEIQGCVVALPSEPEKNTATRAAQSLIDRYAPGAGVALSLHKGIPLSSGLGGSAASAVAAVVATNAALELGLDVHALYPHALVGEAVASGAVHGDNVAPQLLGGLVLALPDRMIEIPTPSGLFCAVVHPISNCRRKNPAKRSPNRIRSSKSSRKPRAWPWLSPVAIGTKKRSSIVA
jgi:homoserine kinase